MARIVTSWLPSLLLAFLTASAAQCALSRAGEAPAGSLAPPSVRPASAPAAAASAALPSTLIELDGTSSVSPDGGELTYEWKQLSGPKVELANPDSAKPYFRTSQPGIYEFELVVEANGLKSEPHLVRLEIERENLPPVAKLLPESWGQVGKVLEIDASGSADPEGEALSYRWRALTPGLVLPAGALDKPALVFEPSVDGVFEVELVVSDGEKASQPVVTRLTIKPRPKPPIAKVEVKTLKDPAPAKPDVSAMSPPAPLSPLAPPPAFPPSAPLTPPEEKAPDPASAPVVEALRPLPLTATPPPASIASATATASPAVPVRRRPVARPVARIDAPVVARAGETVTLDARSSAGESGNRLEFLWRQKSGAFINDFELVFDGAAERFKAPRPGDYEFELSVVDAGVESAPVLHRLKVVEEEDPPVAVVVAPTRAMPGALVKMDATQSYDMAGSPLVYRWRQTGGPAVKNYVIDETLGDSAPAFHPPTAGVYSFELVVSNGRLTSKPIEVDIEVGDARSAPAMTVSGAEAANAGERVVWDIALVGGDAGSVAGNYIFEWRQTEGPANATLRSRGLRSLVMAPIPGRYVFEVAMKDRSGSTLSTSGRVLEVFGSGRARTPRSSLVQPPSPVPDAAPERQRRVVPEINPLPNAPATPPPPMRAFPRPAPAESRQAAKILQG